VQKQVGVRLATGNGVGREEILLGEQVDEARQLERELGLLELAL